MKGIIINNEDLIIQQDKTGFLKNSIVINRLPWELARAQKYATHALIRFGEFARQCNLFRANDEFVIASTGQILRYKIDYTMLVGMLGSFFIENDMKIHAIDQKKSLAGLIAIQFKITSEIILWGYEMTDRIADLINKSTNQQINK